MSDADKAGRDKVVGWMQALGLQIVRLQPVSFDLALIDLVEHTAQQLGCSVQRMPSGAGHDAGMLALMCSTAMIFVPSVNGIGHNVKEYTPPAEVNRGANVCCRRC